MFSGFTALTQVKGLVVTGSVTSLASMFSGCSALTVFDTIGWDTSAVTTIEALAYNCTALTKVDLGSKDMGSLTSAGTTDTTGAFGKCSNLANFDVSHWNAPNLTSLRAFLYQCTSLTKFDASTWDAPKVANMWGMFATCSALTEIDISGIDTTYANAQGTLSVGHLFHISQASARNLSKLTIGKFDTSKVATLESFFWYACGEKKLELHCKSAVVPSISSDTSKIWFRAGNTSASHNGKQMVGSVYVPTGYMEDYKTAWSSYLSSDTTWHEE
jgi:surface protein